MFGKKKKLETRLVAMDAAGHTLLDVSERDFELPEAVTLALSVEYFNDPEPCEIHRAAVRWRALQQLQDGAAAGEASITALDSALRGIFPEGATVYRVATES